MIYAWFDIETPGFLGNPGMDVPLEFAVVLTRSDLEPIPGASLSLIIRPASNQWMVDMDQAVVRMHTKNGLLREVPTGMPVADAEHALVGLLRQHASDEEIRPSGSGIRHFDLPRIRVHFPKVYRLLDEKPIDLSETRRFLRDICGREDLRYEGRGKHRAMPDVEDTLAEARALREALVA